MRHCWHASANMACPEGVTDPFCNQHTPLHPAAGSPIECANHQPHCLILCGAKIEQVAELTVPLRHHITIHEGAALPSGVGGRQHCQAH